MATAEARKRKHLNPLLIGLLAVALITGSYAAFLLIVARRTRRAVPVGAIVLVVSAGLDFLSVLLARDVSFRTRTILSGVGASLGIIGVVMLVFALYRGQKQRR